MNSKNSSKLDRGMLSVAQSAVKQVREGDVLGLGSGSAVALFASTLGNRVRKEKLKVFVVPSSMQAWNLARENGLVLAPDSAHCPKSLDIAVDGADQIATENRSMIKGGGGQLLREKVILSSSKSNFILVQRTKVVERLSRAVPVEVVQFALETARENLRKNLRGSPVIRLLEKGYPYFTESGNLVLDVQFESEIREPKQLEAWVKAIPGVVEVGVFNCKVEKFFVGNQDGSVESI